MKKRALALLFALLLLANGPSARALDDAPYSAEPTAPVWRTYDPALHYYYNLLTDEEKRVFSARYDCIALGETSLWDQPGLDGAGLVRVDYALLTDCPELMYMPTKTGPDGALLKPEEAWCAGHPGDIERLMADCRAALEAIAQRPEWGESDFEKQLAVDRYIVSRCRYDVEAGYSADAGFTPDPALRVAWGALVGGEATCAGYAQGVQLALRCLGIPCLMTYGYIRDEADRAIPHAWNMAKIDGAWYHHDATWNDLDDAAMLEDYLPYFNLTTRAIRRTHSDDPARPALGFPLPRCDSAGANYCAARGQTLGADWREALPEMIDAARKAGRRGLGVRFDDEALFDEAMGALEAGNLDEALSGALSGARPDVYFIYFRW